MSKSSVYPINIETKNSDKHKFIRNFKLTRISENTYREFKTDHSFKFDFSIYFKLDPGDINHLSGSPLVSELYELSPSTFYAKMMRLCTHEDTLENIISKIEMMIARQKMINDKIFDSVCMINSFFSSDDYYCIEKDDISDKSDRSYSSFLNKKFWTISENENRRLSSKVIWSLSKNLDIIFSHYLNLQINTVPNSQLDLAIKFGNELKNTLKTEFIPHAFLELMSVFQNYLFISQAKEFIPGILYDSLHALCKEYGIVLDDELLELNRTIAQESSIEINSLETREELNDDNYKYILEINDHELNNKHIDQTVHNPIQNDENTTSEKIALDQDQENLQLSGEIL